MVLFNDLDVLYRMQRSVEIINGLGVDCENCKIYVPRGSVLEYKICHEGWRQYAHMITADYSDFEDVVVPSNEIWYTSEYEQIISPTASAFGVNLVTNVYKDGKGVLTFDGDVTHIGDYAFQRLLEHAVEDCKSFLGYDLKESHIITQVGVGGKSIKKQESEKITNIAKSKVEGVESKIEVRKRYYKNYILSIFFPNSVKDISSKALHPQENVEYIHFCGDVESITSFRLMSLACVKFGGKYVGANGLCLITNGVLRVFASSCGERSYVIPDSVTSIGFGAFYGCSSLESIFIPDGVTQIGNGAFSFCNHLTNITIPEGVTEIGHGAFSGCSSLTRLYCKPLNPPQREKKIGTFDCPPPRINNHLCSSWLC